MNEASTFTGPLSVEMACENSQSLKHSLGGGIRDMLGGESPIILKQEIYITAALLGSTVFLAFDGLGFAGNFTVDSGFLLPLPEVRQRPRVPDAKSTRIPASRFHPFHAPQAMQSAVNFPDDPEKPDSTDRRLGDAYPIA